MTSAHKQPSVGRYYKVPTLHNVPILPTIHTDAGVTCPHVHIDMRFVRRVQAGIYEAFAEGGDQIIIRLQADGLPHDTVSGVAGVVRYNNEDFETRWLRCLQKHTWDGTAISGATHGIARPVCVGDRRYCPHAGADVTDLTSDDFGFARCPLHGQLLDMRL